MSTTYVLFLAFAIGIVSGMRSLTAPVDSLLSNWAYMVMTSLAWNLKAWLALSLPETGGHAEQRRALGAGLCRGNTR